MFASPNVDSYNFLSTQRLCLSIIGIDLYARPNTQILKYPGRFFVLIIAALLMSLAMAAFIIKYYNEMDEIAKVLTVCLQCVVAILKTLLFLAKSRQYIRIISDLNEMAMWASISERRLWFEANKTQAIISKSYFIICLCNGFMYAAVPLVYTVINHINGKTTYYVPFNALYPYDYNKIPYYILTWLWSILLASYAICALVGIDSLFCWFVYNSAAHFQLLREQLRNIANELLENNFEHFRRNIAHTVAYHRLLVELIKEFRTIFAPIIFIEVSISCLKLCFSVIQISSNFEPIRNSLILMVMAIIFTQLLVYCFGGEKLKQESELFSESIYLQIPWESLTPQMKRLLLLPLIRSQQVETLSGYIFVVDRNLMVWIFKTAGSVFGLLSAMKEKQLQV